MTPVVHFQNGIVQGKVFHSRFQLLIIGGSETVEVLVVDSWWQHKVLELPFGNVFAPRHFLSRQESIMNTFLEIRFVVINAVA